MATFNSVASDLAESATVIIYDRAGYGSSEAVSGPKDAVAAEAELSRLLSEAGVDGPFVLVGHSLGGLFAEYYAAKHPDRISALILEESRPAPYADACEAAGLPMCTPTPAVVVSAPAGARAEVDGMAATVDQVEAAGAISGKPVLILSRPTALDATPTDALWAKAQQDLAARYPGSQHLVAPGGAHNIHLTQRAWFVSTIQEFLRQSNWSERRCEGDKLGVLLSRTPMSYRTPLTPPDAVLGYRGSRRRVWTQLLSVHQALLAQLCRSADC